MELAATKVLVVEDNRGDYRLAEEMLASAVRARFEPTWAATYELGIEQLRSSYDVALVDYKLGEHTGLDVLHEAKKVGCRFPLIMLTGLADPLLDEQAVAAGAADFFPKNEMTPALLERTILHAIERARVNEELRKSELKFRSITESATEGIIATDKSANIISWNKGAQLMFGYAAKEVLGKPAETLITFRNREDFLARVARVRESGSDVAQVGTSQLHGLSKGGSEFPVEVSISTWDAAGAQFFGLIVRDIAERLAAQNQLAEEHNLLRSIIDNLPDHIYVKDVHGNYVIDNAAHRAFMGATDPGEIVGKTVFDLFPPDLAQKYHADDVAVIRSNQPLIDREEPAIDRPHGQLTWFSTTKIPLVNTESKVVGLVCMSRDITQRRIAEEARAASDHALRKALTDLERAHAELKQTQMLLFQAEKMESLGTLSAGIAHEVKNPLGQVLLAVDFLAKAIPPAQKDCAEVLEDIRNAVVRMDTILRGMLDFSAPGELNLRAENLNATVESTLLLLRLELIKHHVNVEKKLAEELPPVQIDRAKLEQVLLNLCTNAMHAMPKGGTLTVTTHAETLAETARREGAKINERLRAGDTVVVVEICDTGHGIPPDKVVKLFDPFFTTKPAGKGTGLGLTVTKKIVELHGGTIELGNRRDVVGAAARITLKAEQQRS